MVKLERVGLMRLVRVRVFSPRVRNNLPVGVLSVHHRRHAISPPLVLSFFKDGRGKQYAWAGAVAALAAALLREDERPICAQDEELQGKADMFGGILIDVKTLPASAHAFDKQLARALDQWRAAGKKGIWLKLRPEHAALLATAYRHGFEVHHANKENIVLVQWLPSTPSTIPQPSSHYVGVGVAVVDERNRILVVQEKFGPASRRGKDFWKMPTGLVDNGEDIAAAAVREVMEETGVKVRFEGVLAFRQNHKTGVEGKTDLFFLCKATPLSSEIIPQESEIARAEWMPLEEYFSKPLWPDFSAYWWMSRLAAEAFLGGKGDLPGFRLPAAPGSRPGHNYIYSASTSLPPEGDHAEAKERWKAAKQAQSKL